MKTHWALDLHMIAGVWHELCCVSKTAEEGQFISLTQKLRYAVFEN